MIVRTRNPDATHELPGPMTVEEVLARLDILPHTVLVIHDGQLVTADHVLPDDADVEVRSVISGGSGASRCVTCRGPAVIEEPRHRAAWCPEHFPDHVQRQVRKAIDHGHGLASGERMFSYEDRLLVAVSGGKDSLALWDILLDLGYEVDGLYVELGIGGYSSRSGEVCRRFAEQRGAMLHEVDLAETYGYTTPSGASAAGRSTCGVCGVSKRYVFNRVAVDHGYDVLATGHNLDDEAATLLGNLLRWHDEFLARQGPVLRGRDGIQARKCKPLYRLSEREMAAYCVVRGIDYVVEECPLVAGNSGHEHKAALDVIEASSPGVKAQLLFGFLDRQERLAPDAADTAESPGVGSCDRCGMPTTTAVCAFCRQRERILAALPVLDQQTAV